MIDLNDSWLITCIWTRRIYKYLTGPTQLWESFNKTTYNWAYPLGSLNTCSTWSSCSSSWAGTWARRGQREQFLGGLMNCQEHNSHRKEIPDIALLAMYGSILELSKQMGASCGQWKSYGSERLCEPRKTLPGKYCSWYIWCQLSAKEDDKEKKDRSVGPDAS